MTRTGFLALATATALVGCPLPQPLPEYSPIANTPPRIVVDDSISPIMQNSATQPRYRGTVVPVPSNCGTDPLYELDARIRDTNTIESIAVRWFVNYDNDRPASPNIGWRQAQTVSASPTDATLRDIDAFLFNPYAYPQDRITFGPGNTSGEVHVVELVVSNGFWPAALEGEPLPNRSPASGFEVQIFRWVFLNVPAAPAGSCLVDGYGYAVDPLCAECPTT